MKSPFKFLDSYTKDDRDIFFGRDHEIEELYQKVFDSKLLLVYGISGTGKSSLIHCGLANKFSETDWLPLVIRREGNIIDSMAASIREASITPLQSKIIGPADFKKSIRSLYLDHYKPVFLIFDQFEELFIFGNKEERREFIHIIKSLIESDLQCRLIFVMREEYMAGVTEFERYIPTFFANRVRIEKMSYRNALDAIKEPCKVYNISLEEGFAESLLEKLTPGSAEVELTYLQVFLDKIFQLAQKEAGKEKEKQQLSFTLSLLNKIGNVSDLLGSFLEDQISILDDPDTALLVLKSLVSVQGTKRQMSPEEITDAALTFGKPIETAVLQEMLQTFISLRILCEKDENGKVELRHDALAIKIFEKFTLAEKELLEVRKYIENAYFTFQSREILLKKDDLDYLKGYENKLILPQYLNEFINMSRQKLYSQKKALTRITRISTLIFVLLLAAIGRFYFQTQQNTRTKDLLGLALIQSGTNPLEGLNTLLGLWETDSSSTQLHYIILKNLQNVVSIKADTSDPLFPLQEYLKPVNTGSLIINAELSKSGKYIYGWLENQDIFILEVKSKKIQYAPVHGDICDMKLSEEDLLCALVFGNNTGMICNFNGDIKYSFETTLNEVMNKKLICFFPSGDNQLAVVKDKEVLIYNQTGQIVSELKGHTGDINSVDISPNGKFIATASSDRQAYIWNYNYKIKQYGIYDSLVSHKDIVWSCRFNKTGKYIITASADSTIRIWDLNGTQLNPEFHFLVDLNTNFYRYRYNNGEYDEDASNPEFSKYYSKFCDAEFGIDEKEIIATGYNITKVADDAGKPEFQDVLFFDAASSFPKAAGSTFYFSGIATDTVIPKNFRKIVLSPNVKVAAGSDSKSDRITIFAGDRQNLLTLNGKFPMFPGDGNELFWINGNEIFRLPVVPDEIKHQFDTYKISGQSKEFDNIRIGY